MDAAALAALRDALIPFAGGRARREGAQPDPGDGAAIGGTAFSDSSDSL